LKGETSISYCGEKGGEGMQKRKRPRYECQTKLDELKAAIIKLSLGVCAREKMDWRILLQLELLLGAEGGKSR